MSVAPVFDLTFLVDGTSGDPHKMATLAMILAMAAVGEAAVMGDGADIRVIEMRRIAIELERRIKTPH